jgi:hypothetical protein
MCFVCLTKISSVLCISFVGRYHTIEDVLIQEVREARHRGECVSGKVIKEQAKLIAADQHIAAFAASQGWLVGFLYRHRLVLRLAQIFKIEHREFFYLMFFFFLFKEELHTRAHHFLKVQRTLF